MNEFFFISFEECDFFCVEDLSLGDLNNDSSIDIIDIVALIGIITGE